MSTTTSPVPPSLPPMPTPTVASTTFTTQSLVTAVSASEKTVEIVNQNSVGSLTGTYDFTIPYTATTAFASASMSGVQTFTSVETSWTFIVLSTINEVQPSVSGTGIEISVQFPPTATTSQTSPTSASLSSNTSSKSAGAMPTPAQSQATSTGMSFKAKRAITTGICLAVLIFAIALMLFLRARRRRRRRLQSAEEGPLGEAQQVKPELGAGYPKVYRHEELRTLSPLRKSWWGEPSRADVKTESVKEAQLADPKTAETSSSEEIFEDLERNLAASLHNTRRKPIHASGGEDVVDEMEIGRAF